MLTRGMGGAEQLVHLARALLTGSAPRFDQHMDFILQKQEWEQRTGGTLDGQWFAVVHPGGDVRYIRTGGDHGFSTWERPDAPMSATFTLRPEVRLVSSWLTPSIPPPDLSPRSPTSSTTPSPPPTPTTTGS
ncbi:hypothetical protein ACFQV2_36525 [Actinokineospora soli]|uniref:Beta-lactamase n=1 Tax=Actinokineospora soli TaxID=1048753 RepID=A0ABW2TXX5_9PSEU